jgi:hypothetical protein
MAAPMATQRSGSTSARGCIPSSLLESALHERRPRRAADEQDFIDVGDRQSGTAQGDMHGFERLGDIRFDHLLVFVARDFDRQVDRHPVLLEQDTLPPGVA